MFNGAPATYADIAAGAVFERTRQNEAIDLLANGTALILTVTGAAGVGKTTFARQIMLALLRRGVQAWEHRSNFPFEHHPWIGVESELRATGRTGVLLLDECTHFLRQTNLLADYLAGTERAALRMVLTANSAQWAPRMKSPNIFAKGTSVEFSRLEDPELNSLINLVEHNPGIASLVHNSFKRLARPRQFQNLRQKCGADMYVCLKNIFENENLDTILLREYDELSHPLQESYRYVAALESVGMRVHRQLLIRMLNMQPMQVSAALAGLSGIVDEYDIDPREGIYGWSTRHLVIARKITEYKFSNLPELTKLFEVIIDNLNPTVPVELLSIRDICDTEFGIGRLADPKIRQTFYRRLIETAPGERIPWHRLIREMLNDGNFEDTEYVIRNAEEAVGSDSPIDRYKVRLLILRAERTEGIADSDRLALLRRAYELATNNVDRYKWDKLSYVTLCDVAVLLIQRGESEHVLEEAINRMREASNRILDPDMIRHVRRFEQIQARTR
jgi:hypothetical protein